MAFTMTCTNKGCGNTQTPYLDRDTDQVFCSMCNKEILNVTVFAKNQMKMSKQYKQKEKKSFSIKCNACKAESRPKIVKDDVVCGSCNKNLNGQLSPPYLIMLKQQLKKADQDV